MNSYLINRRDFLRGAHLSATVLLLGGSFDALARRTLLLSPAANQTNESIDLSQAERLAPDAEIAMTSDRAGQAKVVEFQVSDRTV